MKLWMWGLLVVMTDQLSKWFFPAVVTNLGTAFGWGADLRWEASSIVILGLIGLSINRSTFEVERLGLSLILAGGISNLMDRAYWGFVRDFVYWPVLNVYGNLADVWLTIGAGVVLWSYFLRNYRRRGKIHQ